MGASIPFVLIIQRDDLPHDLVTAGSEKVDLLFVQHPRDHHETVAMKQLLYPFAIIGLEDLEPRHAVVFLQVLTQRLHFGVVILVIEPAKLRFFGGHSRLPLFNGFYSIRRYQVPAT